MTLAQLTSFFGWVSVINIAILLIATVGIVALKQLALRLHSSMFGLSPETLNGAYFSYLAHLKLLTIVFGITPWIALKLMSQGG